MSERGTVRDLAAGVPDLRPPLTPSGDMTRQQEDAVHELMGRVRRGTLSRQGLSDALAHVSSCMVQACRDDRDRLQDVARVYDHVLRYGEFRRNPSGNPRPVAETCGCCSEGCVCWEHHPGRKPAHEVRPVARACGWHGRSLFARGQDQALARRLRTGLSRPTEGHEERAQLAEARIRDYDDPRSPLYAPNPQLQVIENPRGKREDASALFTPDVRDALELFHGTASGDVLMDYGDASDGKVNKLTYKGHCPYVSWVSDAKGAADHEILVGEDLVRFHGFRVAFRGENKPVVCKDLATGEAVIVGGTVARLKEHLDARGRLGKAHVVEYVVEEEPGSSKGDDHYVHEFKQEARRNGGRSTRIRPWLQWDDEIDGLRYVAGAYRLTDWFHD